MAQGWASGADDRGGPRAALGVLALTIALLSLLIGLRLLFSGAAAADPSLVTMWLAATLLLALAAATHWAAHAAPDALGIQNHVLAAALRAAPTAALAVNLAALAHLGLGSAAVVWLAGMLAIWLLWRRWPVYVAAASAAGATTTAAHDPSNVSPPPLDSPGEDLIENEADPSRVQRSERSVADGAEVLRLWQRIELPPWERQLTVHWPFWPALAQPPEVEAEAISESGAEAHIEQAECYGCRIRVVVEEADERPQTIELEAVATAPLPPSDE